MMKDNQGISKIPNSEPDRMSQFLACREKTKSVLRVLDAIIEAGEPESRSCARENINPAWFRRYVQSYSQYELPEESCAPLQEATWSSWQERFLRDLCCDDITAPEDFETVFEEVTATCLDERSKKILLMRYADEMTLDEIGKQFSLTRERIRTILVKVMRTLRNPQYRLVLCYGKEYAETLTMLHTAQAEYDRAYRAKQAAEKIIASTRVRGMQEQIKKLQQETEVMNKEQEVFEQNPMNSMLGVLDLSQRSHNALSRYFTHYQIKPTIGNLAKLSGHLNEISGIGKRCKEEIIEVMWREFQISME